MPQLTTSRVPAGFAEATAPANGITINYVRGGTGPTLVLLHGYPQTWYMWRHVMPTLAEHYTVIVPDLPGAGGSDAPPTGYDKKTMAADIHGHLAHHLAVPDGRDRALELVARADLHHSLRPRPVRSLCARGYVLA